VDLLGYLPISGDLKAAHVLAFRPAPLVVNAQGYHGTTGSADVDYNLADVVVAPPELQSHYSESLLILGAGSFHVNAHVSQFSQLSRDFVLSACSSEFGNASFRTVHDGGAAGVSEEVKLMSPHAFYKLSPPLLLLWASLLDVGRGGGVGGAGRGGGVALHVFRKQHYRVAVTHLVDAIRRVRQGRGGGGFAENARKHEDTERIYFGHGRLNTTEEEEEEEEEWRKLGVYIEGGSETRLEYMTQLCHGDVLLDTPDFNAHTTAVDALWVRIA
jgi:hypothetical protein